MTDIVERLRLHGSWRDSHGELNNAPHEAADEIDRLRRHADALAGALETLMDGDLDVSHMAMIYADDLFDRLESAYAALAAYRKGEGK